MMTKRLLASFAASAFALLAASASLAQTTISVPALEFTGGSSAAPTNYGTVNILWAQGTVAGLGTMQWPYQSLWLGTGPVGISNGLPITPATGATWSVSQSGTWTSGRSWTLGSGDSISLSGQLPAFAATPTVNVGTMPNVTVGTMPNVTLTGALPGFASTPTVNIGTLGGAAADAHLLNVQSAPGTPASTANAVQGVTGGVAVPVSNPTASLLNATVVGIGGAGTPSGGVVSVQGVAGGQAVPITGTVSASIGNFAPTPSYAALSVSSITNRVATPTGTSIIVYNTGSTDAYVTVGGSTVTATTSNDVVKAGGWMQFTLGSNTYVAGITASSSTTLVISGGSGIASGTGAGGSGGSVPTGSAGSPNASVVTVQGPTSGGSAVPVSGSVTATISGTPNVAVTSEVGVGSTGSGIPGSAQLAGFSNGGTLTALTGGGNGIFVDGHNVTQPVSMTSLPGFAATPAVSISGTPSVSITGTPTVGLSGAGFAPNATALTTLSAITTTSASYALSSLTGATIATVYNKGANDAYVTFTVGAGTATTNADIVRAGSSQSFLIGSNTYINLVTQTGATNVNVTGATGVTGSAPGGYGLGGGTVTQGANSSAAGAWYDQIVQGGSVVAAGNGLYVQPGTGATWTLGAGSAAIGSISNTSFGATLNASPSLANGNGVVDTVGGAAVAVSNPKPSVLISLPAGTSANNSWRASSGAITTTGATSVAAGAGAAASSGNYTYVTDLECSRTDTGTAAITVTLSDGAATVIVLPNSGGGGGWTKTFGTPLRMSATNTAPTVTAGTAVTSLYCSAQGFFAAN